MLSFRSAFNIYLSLAYTDTLSTCIHVYIYTYMPHTCMYEHCADLFDRCQDHSIAEPAGYVFGLFYKPLI